MGTLLQITEIALQTKETHVLRFIESIWWNFVPNSLYGIGEVITWPKWPTNVGLFFINPPTLPMLSLSGLNQLTRNVYLSICVFVFLYLVGFSGTLSYAAFVCLCVCVFVFLYLCLFIILTAPVSLPPLLVCAIPILQSYMLHIYMFQLLLFSIHLSFVWTFLALRCSVSSCWKTKKFATNHSGNC